MGDFEDFCPGKKIGHYLTDNRRSYLDEMETEALEASVSTSLAKLLLSSAYLLERREKTDKELAKTDEALSNASKQLREAQLQISSKGRKISSLEEEVKRLKEAEEGIKASFEERITKLEEEHNRRLEEVKTKAVEDYRLSVQYVLDMKDALLETRAEVIEVCANTLKAQNLNEAAALVEKAYEETQEPSVATSVQSPTHVEGDAEVNQEEGTVVILEEGEVPATPALENEDATPATGDQA